MPTFLVIGATGRQGGSTARLLLESGAKVHALVRNPSSEAAKKIQSLGAALFEGDSANTTAIQKALEGVTGVFFNPPYPGPETAKTVETFIQICHKATITTFVVSSAAGTEMHAQRLKDDSNYTMNKYFGMSAAMEEQAKAAGFKNLVILRPTLLMHEYLLPDSKVLFPELHTDRKLVTALRPETKVPHLQAEDVGKFAAAALMQPEKFRGREINLAADNLTATEVAKTLRSVAGREVEVVTPEFVDGKAVGVNSPMAMYHQWTNEVDASIDTQALETEYGVKLTRLHDFLEERREALLEALSG